MTTLSDLRRASIPCAENVTRCVLDNGLIVLVRENHSAPVVTLEGIVPCGALHEPAELAGLAGLTAGLLTRGSRNYPQAVLDAAVEDVGASLGAGAETHATVFGATSLAEDFLTMVNVLADIVQTPTFPEEQVARVRKRRLIHLAERDHDPAQWAHRRFFEGLYGEWHPYGRPLSGTIESVGQIQRADLVDFHRRFYTPRGAILVIAGAVEAARALESVAAAFGNWRGEENAQAVPPPEPSTMRQHHRVFEEDKVQCDMMIGALGPARDHADYYAVRVANTILGQFGMMGRLGERLRDEMGLAYYVSSAYEAAFAEGTWAASIGVNPEQAAVAAAAIVEEFAQLAEEPVDEEELEDSQAYMAGIVPVALETNSGVASTLLSMEWYGLGLDYLLAYPTLVNGVTVADVQRVAQRYLCRQPLLLTVAGPKVTDPIPDELLLPGARQNVQQQMRQA